ncbi:hypothetical protein GOBAR_AA13420 [Gossypium barbadense]|uniref:PI-PLC X domain-containing protein n=1 Tax=Gossypium barbadense TaxID=3634 RepID=A0A2P5XV54_GOSBA|nr:hypothetical protein GOBAR_AA13420 [Gossypium barbadense]
MEHPRILFSGSLISFAVITATFACSNGQCKLGDECSSDADCQTGLSCFSCSEAFDGLRCIRSTTTNQFEFMNGVRALMLDTYDFKGDIWLCHSFGGRCHDFTAFWLAIDTLKEVEAFLSGNPSEIVTLFLEDYVETPNGLSKVFKDAGLMKYWFPVSSMPQNGQDWPLVKDMVASNQRFVVFTSAKSKQESEGIAYQWNYMVENHYGDVGEHPGECSNRGESAPLDDKSKSLVLLNHFHSIAFKVMACEDNSASLISMLDTCYGRSGNRWANFVAVDYYKRSDGGGVFQAVDKLNGQLLCGCDDVHSCVPGSSSATCSATKDQ